MGGCGEKRIKKNTKEADVRAGPQPPYSRGTQQQKTQQRAYSEAPTADTAAENNIPITAGDQRNAADLGGEHHTGGERQRQLKNLKIMYFNAQSLVSKVNELSCITADLQPDIILISETWCNSEIQNAILNVPGYEILNDLRCDRNDTHLGKGGGLIVYAKPEMCILPDDSKFDFNQCCRFTVTCGGEKWLVTLVYRPPSSPPENCELLLKLLDGLPPNSLLVGDFNYPYIDWSDLTTTARGRGFLDKCVENNLEQMVLSPTHIKGNILDLVLTNNPEKIVDILYTGRVGKSDHETLVIEISVPTNKQEYREAKAIWSKANWEEMKKECAKINWREEIGQLGTEKAWEKIKTTLEELQHTYVPTRPWKTNIRPPGSAQTFFERLDKKGGCGQNTRKTGARLT